MFKRIFATALIFGAAALAPPPASAQMLCLARDDLVSSLTTAFEESLDGIGFLSGQKVLEVWTSDDGGSFTLFITTANGLSCILARGSVWIPADDTPNTGADGPLF